MTTAINAPTTPASTAPQAEPDPQETREWVEAIEGVLQHEGRGRAQATHRNDRRCGAARRRARFAGVVDAVHQHDFSVGTAAAARQRRTRDPHTPLRSLERDGDGRASEQRIVGTGRPRRELRVGCNALRRRLQSLLPRADGLRSAATSCSCKAIPRPVFTRARSSKGALPKTQLEKFRREVDGRRHLVVSASVADAGLLAIPDRLDGPGPDHVDLSRALHALHARPRHHRRRRSQSVGVSRATVKRTSPNRSAPFRLPDASESTISSG